MSATGVVPPQAARDLAEGSISEAPTLRGVWFGLLFSVPFWLLIAGLFAVLL